MNLRDIDFFKSLDDDSYEQFSKEFIVEKREYKKDEYIFNEMDKAKDLFILIKGKIEVSKFDYNGKRYIINTLDTPEVFGEVYSFLQINYDFSAIAIEDSYVFVVKDFFKVLTESTNKKMLLELIKLLSKKCLYLSRKNQITSKFTLRQKIANYLILNENEKEVKLVMTREEWSDFLSTTRPSLSRELSRMQSDGLIKLEKNKILILNKKELKEII
ncbi:MAG: Crp/Fnr family transcriptional regulator [Tissierellia bacterium]|nr:Crp/Fnr family transcriptional regulator [Tissierellia bacterium]